MSETHGEGPASAGVIEQAQEKMGAGVEQAKNSASSLIQSQVDERSTQLGDQLHGFVQALRQAERTMEQEGTPGRQLVDRAAAQIEQTARYLSQASGARLVNDFEGLGRRNPWAMIGGGIVLGFLGARFLKASSSTRFDEYRRTYYDQLSATRQLSAGKSALPKTGSAA